ncbi:lipid kinase [Hartmannibacter diazotrophicus]|nr:lipid kinase [Hartmannibacter diazotrophicus]
MTQSQDSLAPERPARQRALVMVNGNARRGREPIDAVLGRLATGGFDLELLDDDGPDALGHRLDREAGRFDCVVIGGGDGTLNMAGQHLVGRDLPLAILPLGTANDLARTLGIGPSLDQAVDVILDRNVRRIDLGEVNGHVFFNLASLGYSVSLTRSLTQDLKRRWGTFGYAMAAMKIAGQVRPFRVDFEVDGETRQTKTLQTGVGNGHFYGGGMVVSEDAQPDDGVLHVYSLEFEHWWQLAGIVPAMRLGAQGRHPSVRSFDCKELTIRTRRAHHVSADGEIVTQTPAHFRILPKAISVFAPQASEQPARFFSLRSR